MDMQDNDLIDRRLKEIVRIVGNQQKHINSVMFILGGLLILIFIIFFKVI
jgi:hypothetical protein